MFVYMHAAQEICPRLRFIDEHNKRTDLKRQFVNTPIEQNIFTMIK